MANYRDVSSNSPCRICQKDDWCSSCSDGTAICRRVSGGFERSDRNGEPYWVYPPCDRQPDWKAPEYEAPKGPEVSKRAAEIYAHVLSLMSLGDQHREVVRERYGIGNPEKHDIVSCSSRDSYRIAQAVAEKFPYDWLAVPGLSLKDGRPSFGVCDGILFPVKDWKGNIKSLRVRRDHKGNSGRYLSASSTKYGGPGPGSQAHYCGFPEDGQADEVRLTEGEPKAIKAWEDTGVPTIGAPGVSQLASTQVFNALNLIIRPKTVVLAPDSDALTNPNVARAVKNALACLKGNPGKRSRPWKVYVEVWDQAYKGIDDALIAGCEIQRLTPAEYLAKLPPEVTNEALEPSELPSLERSILALGDGDCFSGRDEEFFATALDTARKGRLIAPKNRPKNTDKLSKFGGKLLQFGFNIDEIYAEEAARKADLKEKGESDREPTQAQVLLELTEDWELFCWQGNPFASFLVPNKGESGTFRRETHRFSRGGVRAQIINLFLTTQDYPPNSEALNQVIPALESKAMFGGEEQPVFLRTGHHEGRFYVDLCDGFGNVVEISEMGYRITNDPPIRFLRNKSMSALPVPVDGGDLRKLNDLLKLEESSWRLLVAWLTFSLTPMGPFPVLLLEGPAGASKSTSAAIFRSFVDPNAHPLRGKPKDPESLAISAGSNWVVALDNLDSLSPAISDLLCCFATGGAWSARQLYSNDEENVVSYRRPVLMTGIGGIVGRPDLGDRLLKLTLPAIPKSERRTEAEVFAELDSMRGEVFGCLLNAIAAGLRNEGKVKLPPLDRMADFIKFVVQAEGALPWQAGGFIQAFDHHREEQVETALDGDPLATAVRSMIDKQPDKTWDSSPVLLRVRLASELKELKEDPDRLPHARVIGQRLRVLSPYLLQVGIRVREGRSDKRFIKITKNALDLDKVESFATVATERVLDAAQSLLAKGFDDPSQTTSQKNICDGNEDFATGFTSQNSGVTSQPSQDKLCDVTCDVPESPILPTSSRDYVANVAKSPTCSRSDPLLEVFDDDRETFEV